MSNFSKIIFELRKERELTQTQLAYILNLSQRTISSWETGVATPVLEQVVAVADKLEVPYDVLIVPLIEDIKSRAV